LFARLGNEKQKEKKKTTISRRFMLHQQQAYPKGLVKEKSERNGEYQKKCKA